MHWIFLSMFCLFIVVQFACAFGKVLDWNQSVGLNEHCYQETSGLLLLKCLTVSFLNLQSLFTALFKVFRTDVVDGFYESFMAWSGVLILLSRNAREYSSTTHHLFAETAYLLLSLTALWEICAKDVTKLWVLYSYTKNFYFCDFMLKILFK